MLKLPKGLKKKKKGKKSKKDQELFTEEELEQYKREHQLQQQKPNEESDVATDTEVTKEKPTSEIKSEEDDEWSKFKALTAGVDSIVHKTQEDLDRIKSTSFFKRVPPPSEQKKLDEEEAAIKEAERLEQERLKKEEEEANRDKLAEAVVELSESEDESEEADDIFATDYIDAITSGEVQLAVVPDSPDLEVEEGPDPFDTSYADKLIKGPGVSKRGKKLVSLGSAVEVLTGRVDSAQLTATVKRKPRRGPQDLLLDSLDEEAVAVAAECEVSKTPEPPKTLLDDPADELPDLPIDLSVSLHLTLQKEQKEKSDSAEKVTENPLHVASEFDTLNQSEDDEFAELAAESLTKKDEVIVITETKPLEFSGEVEGDWAAFEQQPEELAKEENKAKAKPPARPPPPAVISTASFEKSVGEQVLVEETNKTTVKQVESDVEFDILEDDPFDTTFVEKVLPGKGDDEDDFNFDPRAEEKTVEDQAAIKDLLGRSNPDLTEINPVRNLLPIQKDLLGGSTTDLSILPQVPIAPVQEDKGTPQQFDPFDTSAVTSLVQPKEAELKVLEKELLTESTLKHSLSDPDFDPRAEDFAEESTPIPALNKISVSSAVKETSEVIDTARRKSSLSLNFQSKSVAFLVPRNDILGTDHEGGKTQKPLTPFYPPRDSIVEKEVGDPFDTSFVPETKPTKVELNILEQDLLSSPNLKHSLSDPDFDPRAEEESITVTVKIQQDTVKSDLLVVEDQIDIKVLTPAQESKEAGDEIDSFVDPFDTSIASNILPGRTELKLIESELLPPESPVVAVAVLDTLSDAQALGLGDKVLTPQVPIASEVSLEEVDPFDTSFADNLGPGKTEIKILETELIEK